MASSVALCAASSLLPMLAATGGSSLDRRDYRNGSYVTIATDLAGPWLGLWIVLSAAAANVGMFVSEMSSDAYQLTGMAERGLLPAALAKKSDTAGTPTLAILLSAGGVLALSRLSFEAIVATENFPRGLAPVRGAARRRPRARRHRRTRRGTGSAPTVPADWAAPPGGLAARLGWADRLDDDPAALPEYDAAPPEASTGDEAASPLTS
ncbi:hypothetical protein JL720_2650 [Aureococcus anophagefferens]|nr:hypothetical protein JL720_2650 [Aureococcus anophagefferens]